MATRTEIKGSSISFSCDSSTLEPDQFKLIIAKISHNSYRNQDIRNRNPKVLAHRFQNVASAAIFALHHRT